MIESKDCWLTNNCKKLHCNEPGGCMILFKLDYLYNEANVPLKLRKKISLRIDGDGTDGEEFNKLLQIQDNILDFVKNGDQLLIHSKIAGNGKTSWSLRLLQTYFNKIWLKSKLECKALFVNVPYYLLCMKSNINNVNEYYQHVKENVVNCDLVIWDEIGLKTATTFEHDNLYSMINERINNGKANIFTSNLNNDELREALGDRLASRICNIGYNITFNGGDKRNICNSESKN